MNKRRSVVTKSIPVISAVLTIMFLCAACGAAEQNNHSASILVLSGDMIYGNFVHDIDPQLKKNLHDLGFQISEGELVGLTAEELKQFNCVVLHHQPVLVGGLGGPAGDVEKVQEAFLAKWALLQQYVEDGGGLLVIHDDFYSVTHTTLNLVLKDLGLELINTPVQDTVFEQDEYGVQLTWATTSNFAKHPITDGLTKIVFPLIGSTITFKTDANWQIPIRAPKTASVEGVYESEPPLLAARTLGQGRIVLIPFHSTFHLHSGYHWAYQASFFKRGDGVAFFDNIFKWLSAPSFQAGTFGGFVQPPEPQKAPEKEIREFAHPVPRTTVVTDSAAQDKLFSGIIGVGCTFSGSAYTVTEMAQAAKDAGFDFIVFNVPFERLSMAEAEDYVAQCNDASDDIFLALPGLQFDDNNGNNKGMMFNFALPVEKWPLDDESKMNMSRGRELPLFEFNWPASVYTYPTRQLPWNTRFFNAIEVYGYDQDNNQIVEMENWYIKLQSKSYLTTPLAIHRLNSPDAIRSASGYKTYVRAKSLSQVLDILPGKSKYVGQPAQTFISSGPLIKDLTLSVGLGWNASYYTGDEYELYLNTSSNVNLKEIQVLSHGKLIWRTFPKNTKDVEVHIPIVAAKDERFVVIVEDEAGGRAISGVMTMQNAYVAYDMCRDQQNTLFSLLVPAPEASDIVTLARIGEVKHIYLGGIMFMMIDPTWRLNYGGPKDIIPEGVDAWTRGLWGWGTGFTRHGSRPTLPDLMPSLTTEDCSVQDVDYHRYYSPTVDAVEEVTDVRQKVRHIHFRPRLDGAAIDLVKIEATALEDIPLPDSPQLKLDLSLIGASPFPGAQFSNYAYIAKDGQKITGKTRFDSDNPQIAGAEVPKGGYVTMYPNMYGSPAIFNLNDSPYNISITTSPDIAMGLNLDEQIIPAGTTVRSNFLAVMLRGHEGEEAKLDTLRRQYGLSGDAPGYSVSLSQGELVRTDNFALELACENNFLAGNVTYKEDLLNRLPVIASGFQQNVDAVLFYPDSNKLRRLGLLDGKAYFLLDEKESNFWAGNVAASDSPDLRISLFFLRDSAPELLIHNPTDAAISATITGLLPALDGLSDSVTVEAGGTLAIPLQGKYDLEKLKQYDWCVN